jgi:hypothetical protein
MIRLYSPYCMPTAGAIIPQSKEVSRMAIYKRGENWYVDFTFQRQRIRHAGLGSASHFVLKVRS